jgi:hypothetical protein
MSPADVPGVPGVVGVPGDAESSSASSIAQVPVGAEVIWDEDVPASVNYAVVGGQLAAGGGVFRQGESGYQLMVVPPGGRAAPRVIATADELGGLLADRMCIAVYRAGRRRRLGIPSGHLRTMLRSQSFLAHFRPVDQVTRVALLLPDYEVTRPGYNDGGPGGRIFYVGNGADISHDCDAINRFLDVMAFESDADRTNAVAARLTCAMRNLFAGGKPLIAVTATKSHAGKDTTIAFAAGAQRLMSVSYQRGGLGSGAFHRWPTEKPAGHGGFERRKRSYRTGRSDGVVVPRTIPDRS